MSHHLLIVDDEADLREILSLNLTAEGYQLTLAASGEEALRLLTPDIDLLLVDVMMEGMSGFQLAQRIRTFSDVPLLFLTARDADNDILTGFSVGADDYMTKPFSIQELIARVKAILRRQPHPQPPIEPHQHLSLHPDAKTVSIEGEEVCLRPKEFDILSLLLSSPGRVFSREEILSKVWRGNTYVLVRTVDVHIARLRRKLRSAGQYIVNRKGYGYTYTEK